MTEDRSRFNRSLPTKRAYVCGVVYGISHSMHECPGEIRRY